MARGGIHFILAMCLVTGGFIAVDRLIAWLTRDKHPPSSL
jgi:hypothetical protein